MGNPRPVFRAGPVRAAGPPRRLGESGARGTLQGAGAAIDFICWKPEAIDALAGAGDREIHYRAQRGRGGFLEVEIVAARSA